MLSLEFMPLIKNSFWRVRRFKIFTAQTAVYNYGSNYRGRIKLRVGKVGLNIRF